MIGWSLRKLIWIGVIGVAAAGGGGWLLAHQRSAPHAALDALTEVVYSRMATRLAHALSTPPAGSRLALLPIAGDGGDALRQRLIRAIEKRGGIEVERYDAPAPAASWLTDPLDALTTAWLKKLSGGSQQPKSIFSARLELIDSADELRLAVDWQQVEPPPGTFDDRAFVATVHTVERVAKSLLSFDFLQARISEWPLYWRLLGWLSAVVAPAGLFLTPIRRVLAARRNFSNAVLLVAVALPGIGAGWVLTAFASGYMGGLVAALALVASVAHSYFVLTVVEASS
ncbi:MAG: hypothetical protein ACKVX7_00325 [Planctomycetota bacterium]